MSAYDAFLVELFQYTGKDTLKELSYEDLSRATNKVCKQIYGAKPSEDQKKEQANIKRKVKMEWKKQNETEEGVIKTSMYEEKVAAEEEPQHQKEEEELQDKKEIADEEIKKEEKEEALPAEHVAEYFGSLDFAKCVEEAKKARAEHEEEEEEETRLPCNFGGFDFGPVAEEAQRVQQNIIILAEENIALKLSNQKLSGLIDGLCLGSSIVLSGLLVVMLLYKFI